jgi:hypothetical protein
LYYSCEKIENRKYYRESCPNKTSSNIFLPKCTSSELGKSCVLLRSSSESERIPPIVQHKKSHSAPPEMQIKQRFLISHTKHLYMYFFCNCSLISPVLLSSNRQRNKNISHRLYSVRTGAAPLVDPRPLTLVRGFDYKKLEVVQIFLILSQEQICSKTAI